MGKIDRLSRCFNFGTDKFMKLLHPVSNLLYSTGKLVLFMSGFAFMVQSYGARAETQHHKGVPQSGKHKETRHLKKHVGKAAVKRNNKKTVKAHGSPSSLKAPLAAGAVAGAAGVAAAKPSLAGNPAKPAQPEQEKGTDTGYVIPRFASLRADRVYMRRGPGERYPIDWVYHRRGLPVKIEREFDVWRLVEDSNGQKGWVHRVTLRGNRTFVVLGNEESRVQDTKNSFSKHADSHVVGYVSSQEISRQKDGNIYLVNSTGSDQKIVALLKAGVVGQLTGCPPGSAWCHVKVADYEGWVQRKQIWGLFPEETIETK